MNPTTVQEPLRQTMKLLVACYLGLSVLTLVAMFLMGDDTSLVTDTVWVRGTIVALSAVLTFAFAVRAARGSSRAYLRLRIVSAVMLVAIAVLVSLPGFFPLWFRLEQGVCGLLLLAVVLLVNGRRMRSSYAARG